MSFSKISPERITDNVFSLFGKPLLLAAGNNSSLKDGNNTSFNAMTVSWGQLGVLWGKNTATCFVRPQRYTYEFMENGEYYTLSSYPKTLQNIHAIFGSKSGRDIDKVFVTKLTPAFADCGAPYFEQAELVIVCKKIYFADFDPSNFGADYIAECYPEKDYHRIYIGEIIEVLQKD